jgi:hypothetical protein
LLRVAILILLLLPFGARADQAGVDAIVLGVEGNVTTQREGGSAEDLRVGTMLAAGDRIVAEDESSASIMHRDGSWSMVLGDFEVPAGSDEESSGFIRLRDLLQRYAERAVPDIPAPDSRLPAALGPANDLPVRVLTPSLAWQGEPGVERYRIFLWSADNGVRTTEVEGTSMTLPSEWALTPGEYYEWSVASLPDGAPTMRVRFRVLDREGMDRVADEMQALRESGLDPEGRGALVALLTFQELDLLYDALGLLDSIVHRAEGQVVPAITALRSHLAGAARP